MKKVYYKITLTPASPLRIGNGKHEETDSDLMLDGRGMPFIPGTSLAGVIRHRAEEKGVEENILEELFGVVETKKNGNSDPRILSSSIIIGDAVLDELAKKEKIFLGRRDGVGLNEWGTVDGTSKYDFQIAETGYNFNGIIEWTGDDNKYHTEIEGIIDPILKGYIATGISVGSRTTRGYGKLDVVVRKKEFDFNKRSSDEKEETNDLNAWINFNPYIDAFDDTNSFLMKRQLDTVETELLISFKMISSFSVRVRTARTELMPDGSLPDSIPLENYKKNPVIPGTAWAGVFRHHMHDMLRDTGVAENSSTIKELDALFGVDKEKKTRNKSRIKFSETEITGDATKMQSNSVTRTAIDRFIGAPRNTALFTNMIYSGGEGVLHISYNNKEVNDKFKKLLAACICDMHLGMASLGGETSVGRGLLEIIGIKLNGNDVFNKMVESVKNGGTLDWLMEETENA